ncbi:hypothetical protein TrVFT333_003067 [Trichoderma virens FT-333]|nr:hypothetical protein TrVFT333_003067 [Trichoderma virens FT-333]
MNPFAVADTFADAEPPMLATVGGHKKQETGPASGHEASAFLTGKAEHLGPIRRESVRIDGEHTIPLGWSAEFSGHLHLDLILDFLRTALKVNGAEQVVAHKQALARSMPMRGCCPTTQILVRWLCCPKDPLYAILPTYEPRIPMAFTAISHPYSLDPTVWFTERR